MMLILGNFKPIENAHANASFPVYNPKLTVLEIIDVGDSRIGDVLEDTGSFLVETITMKQFVASREELDGKYDFIAISKGEYSTQTVGVTNSSNRNKAHETTNIQNDITDLKATEIISQFIEKGQLVILEKDSIRNGGKLQNHFDKYNGSDKNVIFYENRKAENNQNNSCSWWREWLGLCSNNGNNNGNDQQQDLISQLNAFLNSEKYKERPRFELTKKPSEPQYQPEQTIQFDLALKTSVQSKNLKAILYIDSDFNDRYDASEMVAEKIITSKNETISYQLPSGYSGVRNWKVEVIDLGTSLKDYEKGTIYFKDQTVEVNVLQVKRNSTDNSSLTSTNNMKQSYLEKNGEYKINIDVTDMNEFNKSTGKFSHTKINGTYDMIIFGFADSYNNTAINNNAVNSVKQFINTNQSILFTHDTIFESNNNWVNNFMEATGQKPPHTNLGYGAPKTSTTTKKMNDGLMTTYPFKLKDNIKIATTHNQYYTLNLEDPNVIPWYNITGGERDPYDSWNHFYTYSKGNITYSGTGHTSSGFPDDEQQLFVNTMYRAFLGSNHAPVIDVITPNDDEVIPAHQKIELSYKVQDFDLKDTHISTEVYLNGTSIGRPESVRTGTTIVKSIDHGLLNNGHVELKIVAIDDNGAKAEKVINLKVEKVKANLEISRTSTTDQIIPVASTAQFNYTIQPREITGAVVENLNLEEVILIDLQFSETFPANVEVEVPDGFEKSGSLSTGYTVTANLGDILYKRDKGNKYLAEPFNFTVTVSPKAKGEFTFNNSSITYVDINNQREKVTFNATTIRADYKVEKVTLPESIVINKGIAENLSLVLDIYPKNAGISEIVWATDNNMLKIDPKTGVLTADQVTEGYVTVTVTDFFGNKKEAKTYVTVRIPVEQIHVDEITLKVGEKVALPITVTPSEARTALTLSLADPTVAAIDRSSFTIEGLKPGVTYIVVTGTNKGGQVITASASVTVEEVLIESIIVNPTEVRIDKFAIFDRFTVTIEPLEATNKNLIWKSLNSSIVEVLENGKIQGKATGTAEIEIYSEDKGNAKTSIIVIVGSPLSGIGTDGDLTIKKGDNSYNASNYITYYPSDATNVTSKSFESSNLSILEVDSTGQITAKRLGDAEIAITVFVEDGSSYSATLKVKVVDPSTNDSKDNKDLY